MREPVREERHWMEREQAAAHADGRSSSALARWSRWGLVLCTAVAVGYGLWALYGSGTRAFKFDLTRELEFASDAPLAPRLGPIPLEPGMNPMRAVLSETHAPVGSVRLHYELSMEDAAGARLWAASGAFGSHDDEASAVMTRTILATFRVARAGDHYLRARTTGASMDDLREAKLELRREVLVVDSRIPWGFGLAALAFLVTSLLAPRTARGARRTLAETPRRAA